MNNLATAATEEPQGLIIDLFAGGGGASEGLFKATGQHPDIAVNHDPEAIAMHEANHPETLHLCEDITRVDIAATLAKFPGRRVDILWASPDCKHHSKAAGGKPKDKKIRGLAWEVLRWSAAIRRATGGLPRLICLENVEEFQDWCPLHMYGPKAGQMQKSRKGETFNLWIDSLYSLGFVRIEWRELVAADYGVPTTRKRLYLVAMSEHYDADWMAPTHAPRSKVEHQGDLFSTASSLLPYRSAAECMDWSIPIPSIFGRDRDLKPKTKARIAKGIKRYVIEKPRPFIVPVTHTKGSDGVRTTDDALKTLTTAKGGEFAVAAPSIMPVTHAGSDERVYDMEDAARTLTAANRGEVALTSAFLKPRYGERDGQEPRALDIEGSAPAVVPTGNGGDLVAVHLGRQFGTNVAGRDIAEPHPTAMTDGGGGKSQIVSAHLTRLAKGSVGGEGEDPLKTTATHGKDGVVAATLVGVAHGDDRARAGLRAWDMEDPARIITGSNDKAIATAYMAQYNGDRVGRAAEEPVTALTHRATQQQIVAPIIDKYYGSGVAADSEDSLDTATAKARFGLAAAFIEQANTGMVGHSPERPLSTLVGKGCTQRLIEATLGGLDAPEGSKRRAVLEFLWEHFGAPTEEECTDPMATASGRLRFGLVVVDDIVYQIVDIGMRMLVPRELYRAQGFDDDYVIEVTFKGKPLTKTAQTRMAGNSVCPRLAEVVARSFMPPNRRMRMAA